MGVFVGILQYCPKVELLPTKATSAVNLLENYSKYVWGSLTYIYLSDKSTYLPTFESPIRGGWVGDDPPLRIAVDGHSAQQPFPHKFVLFLTISNHKQPNSWNNKLLKTCY